MKTSVCIATYNGELYIERQLISILEQLGADDEVIISDDGSSDSTIDIIKNMNDSRIRVLAGPQKGLVKNFENAIGACVGDIIFLSDQDDIWNQGKVSKFKVAFEDGAELVASSYQIIDEFDHEIVIKEHLLKTGFFNNLIKNSFLGCTIAFTNQVKNHVTPFPNEIPMHDWWIVLMVYFKKLNVVVLTDKLIMYRRHSSNASSTLGRSKNSLFTKLMFRVKLLILLYAYK